MRGKLCKPCNIEIEDPALAIGVKKFLKQEVLKIPT